MATKLKIFWNDFSNVIHCYEIPFKKFTHQSKANHGQDHKAIVNSTILSLAVYYVLC